MKHTFIILKKKYCNSFVLFSIVVLFMHMVFVVQVVALLEGGVLGHALPLGGQGLQRRYC